MQSVNRVYKRKTREEGCTDALLGECIQHAYTGFGEAVRVRTVGLRPIQREAPALPSFLFLCCGLDSAPTVALHRSSTFRCSPEGSLTVA